MANTDGQIDPFYEYDAPQFVDFDDPCDDGNLDEIHGYFGKFQAFYFQSVMIYSTQVVCSP